MDQGCCINTCTVFLFFSFSFADQLHPEPTIHLLSLRSRHLFSSSGVDPFFRFVFVVCVCYVCVYVCVCVQLVILEEMQCLEPTASRSRRSNLLCGTDTWKGTVWGESEMSKTVSIPNV
jgi:hypothetical protein